MFLRHHLLINQRFLKRSLRSGKCQWSRDLLWRRYIKESEEKQARDSSGQLSKVALRSHEWKTMGDAAVFKSHPTSSTVIKALGAPEIMIPEFYLFIPEADFFFCVLHFPQGTDVGLSAFVPHMHNAAKTAETGHHPSGILGSHLH